MIIAVVLLLAVILLLRYGNNALGTYARISSSIPRMEGNLPFVGHLIVLFKNYHRFNDLVVDASKEHKTMAVTLPFAPSFIVTRDPENIKYITQTNFDNYQKGSLFRDRMHDVFGNGIFVADGAHWQMQRKLGARVFTTRAFKRIFETVFDRNVKIFKSILEVNRDKCLNMHDYLHRYFLDSFAEIAFGEKLNTMQNDNNEFAMAFDHSNEVISGRFFSATWSFMENLDSTIPRDIQTVRDFGLKLVRKRKADKIQHEDLLSLFMNYDEGSLTEEELVDQVINFIIAGRGIFYSCRHYSTNTLLDFGMFD